MKEKNETLNYNGEETNEKCFSLFLKFTYVLPTHKTPEKNETFRGNQIRIVILYSTPCNNEYY